MVLCVSIASAAFAHHALSIALTPEEHAWLLAHPVIRVAQVADFGPFSFVNERGEVEGLNVDYLALISQETGLRFENLVTPTLDAAFESLKKRDADMVMAIGEQPARKEFMRYTRPFEYSPDAIVTRADSPFLFDLRALDGKRIGIASSSATLPNSIAAQAPEATVVRFPSMADAVRAVSHGEVFAAVTDASVAAFTVKHDRLTNLRVGGVFVAGDVHVGVRPDYEPLVGIIDKVFSALPTEERIAIGNRWMALDYESDRRWERASQLLLGALVLGAVVGVFLVLSARRRTRELSVRKRMQEELEVTRDALELANRGQKGLMRMIAHDLRNPLSSLVMSVETLKIIEDPKMQREVTGDIDASVHRLQSLIDTLVDVQAIEDGKRSYKLAPLSLSKVVRDTVSALQDSASKKTITLHVQGGDTPEVESDASALRQVADNLLSNAIKYSPRGSEVFVTISSDDAWVRFAVRDSGPGISAEERERLFHKYGRGSATPTGGEQSTGLGLWIVQQIATGLRGQVRCGSEPGQGATFTFQLPRR